MKSLVLSAVLLAGCLDLDALSADYDASAASPHDLGVHDATSFDQSAMPVDAAVPSCHVTTPQATVSLGNGVMTAEAVQVRGIGTSQFFAAGTYGDKVNAVIFDGKNIANPFAQVTNHNPFFESCGGPCTLPRLSHVDFYGVLAFAWADSATVLANWFEPIATTGTTSVTSFAPCSPMPPTSADLAWWGNTSWIVSASCGDTTSLARAGVTGLEMISGSEARLLSRDHRSTDNADLGSRTDIVFGVVSDPTSNTTNAYQLFATSMGHLSSPGPLFSAVTGIGGDLVFKDVDYGLAAGATGQGKLVASMWANGGSPSPVKLPTVTVSASPAAPVGVAGGANGFLIAYESGGAVSAVYVGLDGSVSQSIPIGRGTMPAVSYSSVESGGGLFLVAMVPSSSASKGDVAFVPVICSD